MTKKILAITLAMLMTLSLAACGSGDANGENGDEKTETFEGVGLVRLADYKGLSVATTETVVTDEEIDQQISQVYFNAASEHDWGRGAEMGDTVIHDFVGKIDGVAFEGGTAEDYELELGSNVFIPGYEEQMVGIKVGETKDLSMAFPDDYFNTEYAGKDVIFTVTCKAIIPPLSDENWEALENEYYPTIDDFRTEAVLYLDSLCEEQNRETFITDVLNNIVDNSDFGQISDDLMTEKREYVNTAYAEMAAVYGMDVATYLLSCGTSLDEIATDSIRHEMVIEEIAKLENITTNAEEINDAMQSVLDYYQITEEEFLEKTDMKDFEDYLVASKVYDFLADNNTAVTE